MLADEVREFIFQSRVSNVIEQMKSRALYQINCSLTEEEAKELQSKGFKVKRVGTSVLSKDVYDISCLQRGTDEE